MKKPVKYVGYDCVLVDMEMERIFKRSEDLGW